MKEFTWVLLCFIFIQLLDGQIVIARSGKDKNKEENHTCTRKDVECLREVLGDELKCDDSNEGVNVIKTLEADMSVGNSSFIWKNAVVEGLRKYKILNFYINNETNTLVFEVELSYLEISSPSSKLNFYLKGREPVVTSDFYKVGLKNLSLTLTVPYEGRYKLCDAHVFAYESDSNPYLLVGNGIKPTDKDALKNFDAIYKDLPTTLKEVLVHTAPVYMNMFLQIVVCDNYKANL